MITPTPSVAPIAKPAQSPLLRGFTATPTIAQTRKKVPSNSTNIAGTTPPMSGPMLTLPRFDGTPPIVGMSSLATSAPRMAPVSWRMM